MRKNRIIKWEDKSTTSKNRALGGKKTTTVSNKMDYTDVPLGRKTVVKPKNVGTAITTTKTNKKGDVVKSKKVITSTNSDLKTVIKTNRFGKEKVKTKKK